MSEPAHPGTTASGMAKRPTIKSGQIVFSMNFIQSVGTKDTKFSAFSAECTTIPKELELAKDVSVGLATKSQQDSAIEIL